MYWKKIFFLGMLISFWATNLFAQAPDTLWTKTYGGTDDDVGYAVEQTSDGGYIIVGYTNSFGEGGEDVYLIKTDADGDTVWTKTYGGTRNDRGYSVQQTSDGGYIVAGCTYSFGEGSYDVYLIKTDEYGNTLWTKTYGETGEDYAYSVQNTADGGYIVAGYSNSFGTGVYDDYDVYIIKTDAYGNTLWMQIYGGTDADEGYSIQKTSDGGYIIVGETRSCGMGGGDVCLIKINEHGNAIWTKTYGGMSCDRGYSVQQTSDGGYITVGFTYSWHYSDIYLIKTDEYGNTLWIKTYGWTDDDWGQSVQETSDGGYVIAGFVNGGFGAIKTDGSGNTLWIETYGGGWGYSVEETSDNGYVIAGFTVSFGAGGKDVYLVKTGPETGIEEKESSQKGLFISHPIPNPFFDRTLIKYRLPENEDVHIVIYNPLGQEIRTLVNRKQNAGLHTVVWDGRDDLDREIPNGSYFLKLEVRGDIIIRKLSIIR